MAEEKEAAAEIENQEWLDSLRWVLQNESKKRVEEILKLLRAEAQKHGVKSDLPLTTRQQPEMARLYRQL